MGQALPLPKRVPYPTDEQAQQLAKHGITVDKPQAEGGRYGVIHLPAGFVMHNNSERQDIPNWYIIRTGTNKAVAQIYGSWKETYDNDLRLNVYDEDKKVELRTENPEPCETSVANISANAITEANGDPTILHLIANAPPVREAK